MITKTDIWKMVLWTTLAGGLAGCVNIGLVLTIPRSAFLAFVLAWGVKGIYCFREDGEVAGVHSWRRVVLEGTLAGLMAGIPLAAVSWVCYFSEILRSNDLPGIEELIIARPLPTLLASLAYGIGLYLACACRQRNVWQAWLMVVPTAALAGFLKVGFSLKSDVFNTWFIIIPCGALPFCLLWLGSVFWKDPYASALKQPSTSTPPAPESEKTPS